MIKSWQAFLAVSLAAMAFAACRSKDGGQPGGGGKGARKGLVVRTTPVAARDVVYKVQALGSLEPEELVQITAEVAGPVREVRFQAGDRVTPETTLVRIDPERYRLEAERAAAAHRKAVADWKRAESESARREELGKAKLVAIEELTRAQQESERLAAEAASAKAALGIALQNQQRSEVRPPCAGQINTRTVDTGQFVQVGTQLATLVDPRRLRLRVRVSESESLAAKEGQTIRFRVTSLGDAEFAARVYHVSQVADPGTRQVEVLAWVQNPGLLKPGFFAEATLATGTKKGAVVVAESAVRASERGFVVYVVDGGKAKEKPVELGLRTGDGSVEIVSGVGVGEQVVSEGSDRLADGMTVEIAGPNGDSKGTAGP